MASNSYLPIDVRYLTFKRVAYYLGAGCAFQYLFYGDAGLLLPSTIAHVLLWWVFMAYHIVAGIFNFTFYALLMVALLVSLAQVVNSKPVWRFRHRFF